ncbi:MAG: phosphoribosyl-AMP cyclohydrolase [Dehalococcoidia bacterium]|jgi:phosphoribosyl-AMP cyclohydrolase|nr:phosphoribosyl-AMP cyclohydrolase [Dehalococcoidia bacterium]
MPETTVDPSALKYDDAGLIPAVLQDAASQEVLMLGWMNEATLRQTLEIGQAVYWSRSRQEVWHKGATSGDYVKVHDVRTDCDADVVLVRGELLGGGVCHTGARSCFVEADNETPRVVRAG